VWGWTFTGTNTGPLRGLPPTVNKVKFSGVAIDRVVDGKIVEEWIYYNLLDLFQQLGFTITSPQEQKPK
jgi:predicted ester cyclase